MKLNKTSIKLDFSHWSYFVNPSFRLLIWCASLKQYMKVIWVKRSLGALSWGTIQNSLDCIVIIGSRWFLCTLKFLNHCIIPCSKEKICREMIFVQNKKIKHFLRLEVRGRIQKLSPTILLQEENYWKDKVETKHIERKVSHIISDTNSLFF